MAGLFYNQIVIHQESSNQLASDGWEVNSMNSVEHQATFRMDQPAEILFPLFSAEGEKLWVPGWDYENISGSEEMFEDFIFLTRHQDHSSPNADTIWLVKSYQPEHYFVQYYKVEPGQKVGLITVQCVALDSARADVEVTYAYTALSESGEKFFRNFTADHYQGFIAEWKTLLEDYFETC
jgi:hypothetical protein